MLPLGAVAVLMRIVERKRLAGRFCLVFLINWAFSECMSVPLKAHIQGLLLKADGMLCCSMQLCPWFSTADELKYPGESALCLLNDRMPDLLLAPPMPIFLNVIVTLCWHMLLRCGMSLTHMYRNLSKQCLNSVCPDCRRSQRLFIFLG